MSATMLLNSPEMFEIDPASQCLHHGSPAMQPSFVRGLDDLGIPFKMDSFIPWGFVVIRLGSTTECTITATKYNSNGAQQHYNMQPWQ
jgi:hypothetical protein